MRLERVTGKDITIHNVKRVRIKRDLLIIKAKDRLVIVNNSELKYGSNKPSREGGLTVKAISY